MTAYDGLSNEQKVELIRTTVKDLKNLADGVENGKILIKELEHSRGWEWEEQGHGNMVPVPTGDFGLSITFTRREKPKRPWGHEVVCETRKGEDEG